MDYKKIESAKVKEMAESDLEKALKDNDLAFEEKQQQLTTANTEIENLKAENKKLKENQKEPGAPKSASDLVKELF